MIQCCQNLWFLLLSVLVTNTHQLLSKPHNETTVANIKVIPTHSAFITQDVIHDNVEMDMKQIIRVNPLDLPSLAHATNASNRNSSLYKIQNLKPYSGSRKYMNMQRARTQIKTNLPAANFTRSYFLVPSSDKTAKAKHLAPKKKLHFLYNQTDLAGNMLSKSVPIHVAPGAYPVYYVIAKTNGRFGKYPLKSFANSKDFVKYLQKNKIANMTDSSITEEEEQEEILK